MFQELIAIEQFMLDAFLSIWPYLLVTIPLAVAVQMSGASRYIQRAFQARPVVAIFLATAVGAFSPFCSCGVIPIIASLLIGGVPLAPVMAFWIASPSMDPETFFLSVGTLGWNLAVWRLLGTVALSLSAGLITHVLMQRGWLGGQILRQNYRTEARSFGELVRHGWQVAQTRLAAAFRPTPAVALAGVAAGNCCTPAALPLTAVNTWQPAAAAVGGGCGDSCGVAGGGIDAEENGAACAVRPASFGRRLWQETRSAAWMVAKFMALAFFLEALITLYVPSEWIAGLLGQQNSGAIVLAALLGVPVYTSNLAALPMISGLLSQGMAPAAALAFLIAGPTTTLPAMAAVWGLVSRRIFALYLLFILVGAVVLGYVYALIG
jgi:uncharacterized membrane protein YraQ (UPF0718 family)